MRQKITKLSAIGIESLFDDFMAGPGNAAGTYLYGEYRIQISKYHASTSERVMRLYRSRRDACLCVVCGKKVTRINKRTGKPYRLCKSHKETIDKKKKK